MYYHSIVVVEWHNFLCLVGYNCRVYLINLVRYWSITCWILTHCTCMLLESQCHWSTANWQSGGGCWGNSQRYGLYKLNKTQNWLQLILHQSQATHASYHLSSMCPYVHLSNKMQYFHQNCQLLCLVCCRTFCEVIWYEESRRKEAGRCQAWST